MAEARGAVDPVVPSPARRLNAEHLTRCRSPPRCWNAIGSRQLVTVTRAEKSAPRSSCAACQLWEAGGGRCVGLKERDLVARFGIGMGGLGLLKACHSELS